MKTKIQIKTLWDTLLYEHEAEDNNVKKTIEEAVKKNAYLSGANLSGANLSDANLSDAYLSDAYLRGADLSGANLSDADLSGANLSGAYLSDADLSGANLSDANLSDAYLSDAYLRGANLSDADLSGANLSGADLRGADLRGADLGDWGKIESASDVLIVGPIGSRNAYTTVYHTDKGTFVQCGCFRGTLDEFVAKVKETHARTKHERDYNALIDFVKIKFSDYT